MRMERTVRARVTGAVIWTAQVIALVAGATICGPAYPQTLQPLVFPVAPVRTASASAAAPAGLPGNCGSLPSQSYPSFSEAYNAAKSFVVGCPDSQSLETDTCTTALPSHRPSGQCAFSYKTAAIVSCLWGGQFGLTGYTSGNSVAECAQKDADNAQKNIPPGQCYPPIGIVYMEKTFFPQNVSETPGYAEVAYTEKAVPDAQAAAAGGWQLFCQDQTQPKVFHTTADVSRQTQSVSASVSWSNSCPTNGFDNTTADCRGSGFRSNKCTTCQKTDAIAGNPINFGTGAKVQIETDYLGTGPFPLQLIRRYNSQLERPSAMGRSWLHSYEVRLIKAFEGSVFLVQRPDGRETMFSAANGTISPNDDVNAKLEHLTSTWRHTSGSGDPRGEDIVEIFDESGRLLSVTNRAGLTQTLAYSDASTPGAVAPYAGLLISVTDPFGRKLSFSYDSTGRLTKVTDPAGGTILMTYTAGEQLSTVTYQDGKAKTYLYNESANTGGADLPLVLTGLIDENGSRFATWQYNALGRATLSEHAGGAGRVTVSYNGNDTATVTDSLGRAQIVNLGILHAVVKQLSVAAPCVSCGTAASTSFDQNANIASRTDFNGNRTNYSYTLPRNLETQRIEGLTAAGADTPQTRRINTQWHATWLLPVRIAEPLRITTYVYNGDGGVICGAVAALCSKSVQATTDANGSLGFGATASGSPRVWTYTYDSSGQVLTMNGPRTDVADVSTYTYYAANDADFGKRGNVASITNAASHATQVTSYDAHGKPLTIVDPNGLTTTLAYDSRQRLTSRTVGGETTTYTYDDAGQLTKVTMPDSSYLSYNYDAAHRLTGIQDNLGNRIAYTLDGMGNRTQEQVYDPSNTLAQTRSRIYSDLNRLFKELGATNQTTEYGYDNQGNVISVKDPLNRVTANQYDPLNRLKQMTDPASGVTLYAYNGLDALSQVTDPRSLATNYTVNGLGDLTQQVSPDTGTTASTYDAVGNLATQTDAKGQTTIYAYDALNRVTLITFHDGSKHAYAYDLGTNGIGRLSSITESNPASQVTAILAYAYDQRGRVITETRSINAIDYVLAYAYDSNGRLTGLTYPSGRTVTYGFDGVGRVNSVTTTKDGQAKVVVQNVQYHPFGGAKSWTMGNGQIYSRTVDLDGRIASYTLGNANYAIGFDTASRISDITQVGTPANANVYGYDNLDRLTSAVLPSSNFSYVYDAVGNRTTKTTGAATDTYTYSSTSNRIATLTPSGSPPRSFVFDANGSTTNDAVNTYTYDTRGRMVQSSNATYTTTYQVNALGQRIRKTNSAEDRVFSYDTWGKLIAESDPAGAVKREYIYLGDVPVGVLQ